MFEHFKLYRGQKVSPEEVVDRLTKSGYVRNPLLEREGDFVLRGETLEVFPFTFEFPVRITWDFDEIERIFAFNPADGRPLWDYELVVVLPRRDSKRKRTVDKVDVRLIEELPTYNFIDFQEGDYVVHTDHGIGRYLGMRKIRFKDGERQALVIEYADRDLLYVPVEEAHLVQRYISFDKRVKVKLSRLGGADWRRLKERVRRGIYNMALEMLKIQALRSTLPGFAFPEDDELQREFEATFPYEETPDQRKAIEEVKRDMMAPRPMDRLICGEVGYGKTEVAMRAAFKAALAGKQVAILVPTTLLAEQHYTNFLSRMERFPVRVEMLSRFRSPKEQKRILEEVREGKVDILIGTHRLLSGDVRFKDLGLLIIDEEQRFGVKHKEKMKRMRALVDVLTMTATPIPRTLYMALMGLKDISVITTPPVNRLAVETRLVRFDPDIIKQAIEREVARGGQVFFVHNRVESIERRAKWLSKLVSARIAIAHGKMSSDRLEEIMLRFIRGEIDVLVCTTIIESGIDIPNANTLIVERADMFGLAELHQLRGRVGRYDRQAYAYFCLPPDEVLTDDARRRLSAIERYSDLGAGFHLAMEDLEIRGAGNVLGTEQHGYITAVGFDLYCRMLRSVVEELRSKLNDPAQVLLGVDSP